MKTAYEQTLSLFTCDYTDHHHHLFTNLDVLYGPVAEDALEVPQVVDGDVQASVTQQIANGHVYVQTFHVGNS